MIQRNRKRKITKTITTNGSTWFYLRFNVSKRLRKGNDADKDQDNNTEKRERHRKRTRNRNRATSVST